MFSFSVLRGEVIALGGYKDIETEDNHGNHAVAVDDRNPLHGYVNAYTEIEITVILTESHTGQRMTPFFTYMALGQEGSLPFIAPDYSHNMVTDADHTAGTPVPAQYALELFDHDSDGADDYRKKYYIF